MITKRKPIIIFLILLILSIVLGVFSLVEKRLETTIKSIAEVKVRQIAVNSIHKSISENIINNVEYEELIKIHKDNNGRIVLMQPNIIKIDQLQSETALLINKSLSELSKEEIQIPVGQILGSQLFANFGPEINIAIIPIGSVYVKPINDFKEAGINQTRHMLSLNVETQLKVVVPTVNSNIKVETEILIADNIILGDVPKEYTKINLDSILEEKLKIYR